jgi:imidazolonepropionase-like amidohydrolase
MAEHETFLVPTVYVGQVLVEEGDPLDLDDPARMDKAKAVAPRMLDSLRLAHEAGVKIAFGTDAGVFSHGTQAREFELLVRCGMTPMEAIKSATSVAAELLQRTDQFGALRPGLSADLIAVRGKPLDDITTLQHVGFVMKQGTIYKDEFTGAAE